MKKKKAENHWVTRSIICDGDDGAGLMVPIRIVKRSPLSLSTRRDAEFKNCAHFYSASYIQFPLHIIIYVTTTGEERILKMKS